ncbi:MAG: TetR/AcrR family transcriptional regulator [Bacteroidetes bacterium]|nr:TetR/AcrR family transcriptional regulator [Bacteroidota bacterium]MBL0015063.1 TetR/AcrR family transcriptional regulator [Bacteroidota bacterium]
MSVSIRLLLSQKLCLRDPNQTELGQKILNHSILLIDELGFEGFTFKKLAKAIGSTEASVYRYFENKHKLLVYLVAWYWAWLDYTIDYQIHNIEDPRRRLRLAIEALANANIEDPLTAHINEASLHRIVIAESSKAFLTKSVDGEREQGLFEGYVQLVDKLAGIIAAVNPDFEYPKALAVTVIEGSRKQLFFAVHIPTVTEISAPAALQEQLSDFLEMLILKTLQK